MVVYKLVALEAQDNGDGTVTLVEIANTLYQGGTNQAKIETVTVEEKEIKILTHYL